MGASAISSVLRFCLGSCDPIDDSHAPLPRRARALSRGGPRAKKFPAGSLPVAFAEASGLPVHCPSPQSASGFPRDGAGHENCSGSNSNPSPDGYRPDLSLAGVALVALSLGPRFPLKRNRRILHRPYLFSSLSLFASEASRVALVLCLWWVRSWFLSLGVIPATRYPRLVKVIFFLPTARYPLSITFGTM